MDELVVLEVRWADIRGPKDDRLVLPCHLVWSGLRTEGRKRLNAENEQCYQERQVEASGGQGSHGKGFG